MKLSEQMNSYFKQPGAVASERIAQGWINKVAKLEGVTRVLEEAVEYFGADYNQPEWFERAKQALAKLEDTNEHK